MENLGNENGGDERGKVIRNEDLFVREDTHTYTHIHTTHTHTYLAGGCTSIGGGQSFMD